MYIYTCGNIINNNDERTHFFRKIYLSHFNQRSCERVVCVRWVGDWTDCNILTPPPPVPLTIAGLLNRAQALCWELVLTASNFNSNFKCNWLQLIRTLCGTRLYNCLTSTCFLWASHLHRIQPVHGQGYILISLTGCTCFSIDGWVEGQYVTIRWVYRLKRVKRP